MRHFCLSLLTAFGCVAAAAGAGERQPPLVWTQDTFADFASGTFEDGGQNLYVSAAGRMQLINKWDLNNDGNPDLVARRPDGSLWTYSGTGMKPSEGYLPRTLAMVL